MIIDYDKLLDKFEEIQDKAYSENKGTNEEQLQVRTDIIEHLKPLVNNTGVLDNVVLRWLTAKISFTSNRIDNKNTSEALKQMDLYDREVAIRDNLQIVKKMYYPNAI